MSKNLNHLAHRQGIGNSLFESLVKDPTSKTPQGRKALAKKHLVGESTVKGTASFYDFIEGGHADKKAYICNGSSCCYAQTQDNVRQQLEQHLSPDDIGTITCMGRCSRNSSFKVDGICYSGNDIEQLDAILGQHIPSQDDSIYVECMSEQPILTTLVTDLNAYYQLFSDRISQFKGQLLLQQITDSGLRGRGGAGFPTGVKWQTCLEAGKSGDEKYIICNADEGDPGAFSDRYLLEENPHSVLFGMLMAGWLTGAQQGILYIRQEYPDSIRVCQQAIDELNVLTDSAGNPLLNQQRDGQDWPFSFKIIEGAGAYICGEETALIRSIEGQRPVVSVRPPFPAQSGLYGKLTALNNVETFSSIHWILNNGPDAFKAMGKGRSAGTKLLSLDSFFNKPGIYEVEMGTPLADVVKQAGGFCTPIKALHIGGPLGGLVPVSQIDQLTIDFESFAEAGFLLGHASIIGIGETTPIIDYLRHLFEFTEAESCGKCFPCRIGSTRGKEMLQLAINDEKKLDRELFDDLLETLKHGSLCALGSGIPLLVENALQWFADELTPYFKQDYNHNKINIKEVR
ncbi:MAG: NADH:ubiquinone oxidoreductase subunit F (NADH-binding) [Alteromonadaceae bacterium]|jgi:NADH:ubiquinone oxidoreductase subunit F (NADH-binding)